MVGIGGLLGVGGGLSGGGGFAGPASSGLSNSTPFNIGGNDGIGRRGFFGKLDSNPLTLLMIGLIAIAVAIVLTRGRGFRL
jgi:hypothetical protein